MKKKKMEKKRKRKIELGFRRDMVFEGRRKEDNLTFLYNFYLKIEKKNE